VEELTSFLSARHLNGGSLAANGKGAKNEKRDGIAEKRKKVRKGETSPQNKFVVTALRVDNVTM